MSQGIFLPFSQQGWLRHCSFCVEKPISLKCAAMAGSDASVKLCSEIPSRWIAEVDGEDVARFTEILGDSATLIGITKGDSLVVKGTDVAVPVDVMRAAWSDPIWKIMGGGAQ